MITPQTVRPCKDCGAAGVVAFDGKRSPGWFVSCPNRNTERGTPAESVGKCSNTRQMFRTTEAGSIAAWNTAQNPQRRKNYDAATDRKMAAAHCPHCGLRGDHECLVGEGFQRKQNHGDPSARVRMGG